MSDDYELVEPENFLEPRRYRVSFVCDRCGHEWKREYKALPKKDPPCPNKACALVALVKQQAVELENLKRIIESGIPPAHIGDKVVVKAIDQTAEIVMQDHKMTDLRDNLRMGDTMAPKLPPQQQRAADSFFDGAAVGKLSGRNKRQMDVIGRRALAGAFRSMAVSPSVIQPASVTQGQSPFRVVRTEQIKGDRR